HRIRFKRHPSDTDRSGKTFVPHHTIVDKFIGDPFLYKFSIQSQASYSCPSRYIVLKDETNHTVDDLQNIANLASSRF
ncbi:hypothetical protein PPACK8108_LOCUS19319, partial [Phakopsora pachyrhizi]